MTTAWAISACSQQSSGDLGSVNQASAYNNTYIVQLRDDVRLADIEAASKHAAANSDQPSEQLARIFSDVEPRLRARYRYALQGFALASNSDKEIQALRASPLVKSVQPDFRVQAQSLEIAENALRLQAPPSAPPSEDSVENQTCSDTFRYTPGPALDWLDERSSSEDGRFTERCQQGSTTGNHLRGNGVRMILMDTGIDRYNDDGTERLAFLDVDRRTSRIGELGFSAVAGLDPYIATNLDGTRLAGAAVGAYSRLLHDAWNIFTELVHGVAPSADIVSVRIYDDQGVGKGSDVLSAIDYITRISIEQPKPTVVHGNLIIPGIVEVFEDAIRNSVTLGNMLYVFPGGRKSDAVGGDACNSSPTRMFETLSAGYAFRQDFSPEYGAGVGASGSCVDLYVIGEYVQTITDMYSAYYGSGFSSAFAAGAAAMLFQNHPEYTPAQIRKRLICDATVGVLKGLETALPNTPNRRIYTNDIGNPAPEAASDITGPTVTLESPYDMIPVSGTTFRIGVLDCSQIESLQLFIQDAQIAMLTNPQSAVHEIAWVPSNGFQPNQDGTVNVAIVAVDVFGNATRVEKQLRASTNQILLPIVVRP